MRPICMVFVGLLACACARTSHDAPGRESAGTTAAPTAVTASRPAAGSPTQTPSPTTAVTRDLAADILIHDELSKEEMGLLMQALVADAGGLDGGSGDSARQRLLVAADNAQRVLGTCLEHVKAKSIFSKLPNAARHLIDAIDLFIADAIREESLRIDLLRGEQLRELAGRRAKLVERRNGEEGATVDMLDRLIKKVDEQVERAEDEANLLEKAKVEQQRQREALKRFAALLKDRNVITCESAEECQELKSEFSAILMQR